MSNVSPAVVWNEIGPQEHFCQFYDDDDALLTTVDSFIGSGLQTGDAAVVIATQPHLTELHQRLKVRHIDVAAAIEQQRYAPLEANEMLTRFMIDSWPDQARFLETVRSVIQRISKSGRRIRAFGEMVALLWASGNRPATIRLEQLWNNLAKTESFSLFCAYPKKAFNVEGCQGSLIDICASHSRIICSSGEFQKVTDVPK